MYEEVSVSLMR